MISFKLRAKLKSPVVIGKRSPNLAGILFHVCFLHTGCELKAGVMLATLIKQTDGVFHASDMMFGVTLQQNLIATSYATVGVMNTTSDLTPCQIKPNGQRGTYAKVQVEGGPTKSRLKKHDAYYANSVVFHAYGDHQKIVKLLNYYMPSVGLFANGSVEDWFAIELDDDQSFYFKNHASDVIQINRVPVNGSLDKRLNDISEVAALAPPFYKAAQHVECVMPNRINKILDL
jgi:hypothetical protein